MRTPDERLDAAIGAAGRTPPASMMDALGKAAREELAQHPKTRAWWVDGAAVLALNLLMGLGAASLMSWSDHQHVSEATKYASTIAWFAVMAVGSVWWLKPGPVRARWLIAGGFVVASAITLFGASGFDPGLPFSAGLYCAFAECKVAIVPVVLVVWLSTRFAAQTSHLLVGTFAAASGGALALHLHCPNGTFAHIAVFHVAPGLCLAGLALLTRHFLKPRSFVP